jgi:hypothetical protein
MSTLSIACWRTVAEKLSFVVGAPLVIGLVKQPAAANSERHTHPNRRVFIVVTSAKSIAEVPPILQNSFFTQLRDGGRGPM